MGGRCVFSGTQVLSAMWSSETNILVGLHDDCYSIWYCPGEACMDPTVIALTTLTFEFDRTYAHFDCNLLAKCFHFVSVAANWAKM